MPPRSPPPSARWPGAALLALALGAAAVPAQAQFAMVPAPLPLAVPASHHVSQAADARAYRRDASRHLYASYSPRVYRGRLPPLLYGVALVDVEIDAAGQVVDVRIRRPPAAPEVQPWITAMIRRAAPFPAPAQLGRVVYTDIWLVHRDGGFQLDTLTEGQD